MRQIWSKWKEIAEVIGTFQTKIIFSILYYLVVAPLGLLIRFFADFLNTKSFPQWSACEDNSSTLSKMKMQ